MACMSGELVFVDTNVLVYARDSRDPRKQQRAEEWLAHLWRQRTGRVSVQVLQEYYVSVTQKLKPGMDRESARADVRDLWQWVSVSSTVDLVEAAWTAQDELRLSWWDALVLAAARLSDCAVLLSEDFQHGRDLAGVRVTSPFKKEPRTESR
jgi:predicted nucleic acid-binding protein